MGSYGLPFLTISGVVVGHRIRLSANVCMCDLMVCLVWFHWNFVAYLYKGMVQITPAVGNKVSTESSFCPAQAREADVTYLLMKVNKNEIWYVNNLYENDTGVSFPKSQDTDICSVNRVLFLSSTSKGSWCDVSLSESKQKWNDV